MSKKIFWVDVPIHTRLSPDAEWTNVGVFGTREEAIKFIQDNIDGASEDGKINLITEGSEEDYD